MRGMGMSIMTTRGMTMAMCMDRVAGMTMDTITRVTITLPTLLRQRMKRRMSTALAAVTITMIMTIMITRMTMATAISMADAGADANLPLLIWFSPAFPVGAFAYSHGLEAAVEAGFVSDAASLQDWLGALLQHGGARNDAILFTHAFRAGQGGGAAELAEVNALALALAGSRERLLETASQGNAFVTAARAAWPCAALEGLPEGGIAYPVAAACACAGHDIALPAALQAFVLGFISSLVSAAMRLGAIGQTDGQRVLAALLPRARGLAQEAQDSALDDLGGCAFNSDIAAMRHETQYSRLFRT